ncbi:MAG: protein kinase [Acidobacteria bacterium]|nr:protein kinase [Acidobacteriota bacterium]
MLGIKNLESKMIGQTIGKYKIEKLLGAGGMGEVYLATDTMLNRSVALKFLPRDLESRERVVKRFLREAQATARLSHPNIATLYNVEQHEGRYFILMEYVDGEPLSRLLRRERLSIKNVLKYSIQIAEALGEAHEHGVLHRDVKPGNILINRKQQIKVLDFGLAKFIDSEVALPNNVVDDDITREGVLVGTPRYMAPEQILGKDVDQRADIFALGILLYEMIANQHPFKAANNQQLVLAITSQEPAPLNSLITDIPEELEAIVMKALRKNPSERYQTAKEMATELRSLAMKLFADHYFEYSGAEDFRSDIPNQRSTVPPTPVPPTLVESSPRKTLFSAEEVTMQEHAPKTSQNNILLTNKSTILKIALLALFLMVSLTVGVWYFKFYSNFSTSNGRPLIAVMYFDNFTNDSGLEWLGRGLTEMLTTDLAQLRTVDVVSKQRLFDTLQILGKEKTQTIDRSTASDVARKVGATVVLSGSVLKINNKLRLNVTLEEVNNGKIVFSDVIEGNSVDEVFTLVDAITAKISRHYNPTANTEENPNLGKVTTNSIEAFRLYTRGLERCWLTNFDEGLDDLERAVEIDENFALAYLQIGNAKFVRNDTSGAERAFKKALNYIDRAGYREQMLIQGVNAYYKAYDDGDYSPALAIFEQMEANFPRDKEAFLWKGLCLWRNGDYKKAIASYNKILELDPEFNVMYVSLAQAYADDEDYIAASAMMRKSIALHPGQPDGRNLLGNIYVRMGKYDDALKEYEAMLEIKREYRGYRAYLDLGQVYLLKGDIEKGKETLKQYIELSSDIAGTAWAHLAFYRLAIAMGKSKEAEKHLEAALAAAQKSKNTSVETQVRCYQSDFYLFLGRYDEAISSAKEALSIAGFEIGGREACQQLAIAFLEKGDSDKAISTIDEYIKKLPQASQKNASDLKRVIDGVIAYRAGDYSHSEELFMSPLKYNIRLYSKMAMAQFQAKKYDQASEQFKRLLGRDGFDPERRGVYWSYQNPEHAIILANYYLGRIAEIQNKEASSYYQKFLSNWERADFSRPEIKDAKTRLETLK